jgi:hypothetical protein
LLADKSADADGNVTGHFDPALSHQRLSHISLSPFP